MLDTSYDWHGIQVRGISAHYLNRAFGFEYVESIEASRSVVIGRERTTFMWPEMDGVVLSSRRYSAHLRTGREAKLELLEARHASEDISIRLPLNAALTQQWLLEAQLPVHGALIGIDGRGVLFLGESKSGKSTLVRAALSLGQQIVTDDFLRITFENGVAIGHCMRGFLRFRGIDGRPDQIIALRQNELHYCATHRIDAVVFLVGCERPAISSFAKISRLQATTQMINQCAALFLRREFPTERERMLALIGNLLTHLPALNVSTGFDVLRDPRAFMVRLQQEIRLRE